MRDEERSRLLLETIPRAMRTIRAEMRRVAGDEFTVPQFRLLARVSRTESTNGELAEWMGVSAPSMTRMIDKLVKRGLLTRKANSPDRRQITLKCTKRGLEKTNHVRSIVQKKFTETISNLPEQKRELLSNGLLVLKEIF